MNFVSRLFFVIVFFGWFQSCKKEEISETAQSAILETLQPVPYITKYNSLKSTATMVDVRTMSEFNAGHRSEALNIDINMMDFDTKAKQVLDIKKPVFVYCQSGVRSMNAANRLKTLGYLVLYNLDGGFSDIKNL